MNEGMPAPRGVVSLFPVKVIRTMIALQGEKEKWGFFRVFCPEPSLPISLVMLYMKKDEDNSRTLGQAGNGTGTAGDPE